MVYDPTNTEPANFIDQLILGQVNKADKKDQEYQRNINEVQDNMTIVTLTPWLRHTQWHERFKGKDMKALHSLTDPPKPDQDDEMFLWKSINRVVHSCWNGFNDCLKRGWVMVPFWLASAVRSKESSRPFRTYIASYTLRRYIGYWQRYILFCIRAIELLEFTTQQIKLIQRVCYLMNVNEEVALDEAVLQLSIELIQHSDYSHQRSSLIYFTGVLGYNTDYKQWRQPQDYTTILAGLQFCIRVIMLEAALPISKRDKFTEKSLITPVEQFCNVRNQWLIDGESMTSAVYLC